MTAYEIIPAIFFVFVCVMGFVVHRRDQKEIREQSKTAKLDNNQSEDEKAALDLIYHVKLLRLLSSLKFKKDKLSECDYCGWKIDKYRDNLLEINYHPTEINCKRGNKWNVTGLSDGESQNGFTAKMMLEIISDLYSCEILDMQAKEINKIRIEQLDDFDDRLEESCKQKAIQKVS